MAVSAGAVFTFNVQRRYGPGFVVAFGPDGKSLDDQILTFPDTGP